VDESTSHKQNSSDFRGSKRYRDAVRLGLEALGRPSIHLRARLPPQSCLACALTLVGCVVGGPSKAPCRSASASGTDVRATARIASSASPTKAQTTTRLPFGATQGSVNESLGRDPTGPHVHGRATSLTFHLVAEFPYEVAFAPLGANALLIAGGQWAPVPFDGRQRTSLLA
jgi:hypothetical protein